MTGKRHGFTMIETILVLAIAGLILMMMFIALPALQRQARDTERREDMADLITAIKKFQQNNRGALPSGDDVTVINADGESGPTWAGFYHDYLGADFTDPGGDNYVLNVVQCDSNSDNNSSCDVNNSAENWRFPNDMNVYIVLKASCDGEMAKMSSNPRNVAALYKMEGGGIYCIGTSQ